MQKTVTKTYTSGSATANVSYTFEDQVVLSTPTFDYSLIGISKVAVKLTRSSLARAWVQNIIVNYDGFKLASTSWTSGATKAIPKQTGTAVTLNTSDFFNASNKNSISAVVPLNLNGDDLVWIEGEGTSSQDAFQIFTSSIGILGQTVILNAPPTFNVSTLTFDKPIIYAGLTTASIDVSNLSAKYGGDITKAVLKIGTQESASRTTDGTLSMLLSVTGTDLPASVVVTDSRGQTTTESLGTVTVNAYNEPSVNLSVERTLNTGAPNDEGTYAVLSGLFTFTDGAVTLSEPTVTGATSVTWYTDRNATTGVIDLTSEVDWNDTSGIVSGDTLYGLAGTFQPNESYVITVTPIDTEKTGTPMSVTLPTAFYTIDFLAGGHGIAFGTPAKQAGVFECDLDGQFNASLTVDDDVTANSNIYVKGMLGFVQMYAGTSEPTGWKFCNGQELLKADYAELYAIIRDTYGTASDSDHFVLPNLNGRFPIGKSTEYNLGGVGGSKYIQAHTHAVSKQPTFTIPNHQHALQRTQLGITTGSTNRYFASGTTVGGNTANDGGGGACSRTQDVAVGAVSGLPSGQTTGSEGNMPPYLGINFIIYVGV